jgi:hypothetical protein
MTPKKWIVGIDPYDQAEQGYIVHRRPPEFTAKWMIEDDDSTALSDLKSKRPPGSSGVIYSDADEEAPVAVYDFEWIDASPSEKVFRSTMQEAVNAISDYLVQSEITY